MTGIHTSTDLCVVLKIPPGGAVNTLCVSGQHMTMNVDVDYKNELAVCEGLLGSASPWP